LIPGEGRVLAGTLQLDEAPRNRNMVNVFIDDEVLFEAGVTDLDRYAASPDADLSLDIFVDGWPEGVPA
jgi:hypothetical protein